MMQTISELIPKVNELKEIRQKYDVNFVLEIVPRIFAGEAVPTLAPNREVIEFCYHTKTEINIDLLFVLLMSWNSQRVVKRLSKII